MKYTIYSLLSILFFLSCANTPRTPNLDVWFKNHNIKPKANHHYISYSIGLSKKEAIHKARESISEQINVKIKSNSKSNIQCIIKNGEEECKESYNFNTSQITNIDLEETKIKDYAVFHGKHYVILEYWLISPLAKFIHQIKKLKHLKQEPQNAYLKNTFLIQYLNKQINKKLNYKLFRKNKKWYLEYNTHPYDLKNDFYKLFSTYTNKNLSLNVSTDNIKEDDEFTFSYSSKNKGYLSLINVYEDGTVVVLFDNVFIQANKKKTFPKGYQLQASLMKQGQDSSELLLLLHHKNKIPLDDFFIFNDETSSPKEEKYKNFNMLIFFLDKHKYDYSSLRINIKAKE